MAATFHACQILRAVVVEGACDSTPRPGYIGRSVLDTLRVTSTGSGALTITNMIESGDAPAEFAAWCYLASPYPWCPTAATPWTLKPGEVELLPVSFAPVALGPRRAQLVFVSDAEPGGKDTAQLCGIGFPNAVDDPPAGLPIRADAFPNPAPAKASLRLTLPETGHVRIDLMTSLGTSIRRVFDARVETGEHLIDLPTSDLPDGIYLCRIASSGGVQMSRIVVIR
jgi:hypothetical protein